jgi:hypothetical protein
MRAARMAAAAREATIDMNFPLNLPGSPRSSKAKDAARSSVLNSVAMIRA